jgi:hypothetical protein
MHEGSRVIPSGERDQQMQGTEEYRAFPAKAAQWVGKQVCAAWDGYCAAVAAWNQNPGKCLGHPQLPQ